MQNYLVRIGSDIRKIRKEKGVTIENIAFDTGLSPATISYLENAFNMPVHFFQGGDDPVVKPENTRKWVEDFKKVGAKVTYQEYPGVKHDSWVNAYKDEFIFSWFDKRQSDGGHCPMRSIIGRLEPRKFPS